MQAKLFDRPVREHCELSPSSAYRWMHCPGSVILSRDCPNRETEYAREGTAAHRVAELSLTEGMEPTEYIGREIAGVPVTKDMAVNVQWYVDYVRSLMADGEPGWIERRFTLDKLNPPAPMYGTADFVHLAADGVLHVVDLKFGQGVVVEVADNPQLLYYALGAYSTMDLYDRVRVKGIRITVVQPRAEHHDGIIRSCDVTVADLGQFASELLASAKLALAPGAALATGKHCRFCPALARCPRACEQALAVAQQEFGVLPPEPSTLTTAQVASALHTADSWLENWIHALRVYAQDALEAGVLIPGYKLVQKRPTRRWADEADAEKWCKSQRLRRSVVMDEKLKSVAEIEKILGKGTIPERLVRKESSGTTLAPESDPRPAVNQLSGAEFPALD